MDGNFYDKEIFLPLHRSRNPKQNKACHEFGKSNGDPRKECNSAQVLIQFILIDFNKLDFKTLLTTKKGCERFFNNTFLSAMICFA